MKRLIICEKKRIYHGLVVEDDFDFTAAIENAKTNDRDYVDAADIFVFNGQIRACICWRNQRYH